MCGWLGAVMLACLASSAAARGEADELAAADNPAAGVVADGAYTNAYFGLRYAPLRGWIEGEPGPGPSESGYYVLGSFVPKGALTGTVLIAAQDMFFAEKGFGDAAAMARAFSRGIAATSGMIVERGPSEVVVAKHRFIEFEFSGVGLHRAMFVTEIRCHLLSINLTANAPALRAALAQSVGALTLDDESASGAPICIKDYVNDETLLSLVEPVAVGPRFQSIPVRIVIGTDGRVGPIHVIRAAPQQREAIDDAVAQWRVAPYRDTGALRPVETGLRFVFGADQ